MAYPRFRRARTHKHKRVTTGDLALTSTTWVNLSTEAGLADNALDIVLRAQAGDTIEYAISTWWNDEGVYGYLDVETLVSGAGAHWFGAGEPSTTTGGGVPGWLGTSGIYVAVSGSAMLTLVAGDIVNGAVTLRPRFRGSTAGTKTMAASAVNPLQLWAKNLGPEEA